MVHAQLQTTAKSLFVSMTVTTIVGIWPQENNYGKSELSCNPWGTFGDYSEQSAYGLLFCKQYDGIVAYNWTNGKLAWWFQAPATTFETPYTNGTGELNGQVYSLFSDGKNC